MIADIFLSLTKALPFSKILGKVLQAAFLLACGGSLFSAGVVKAATESFTGFNTVFATPATEGGATIQGLLGPAATSGLPPVGTGIVGFTYADNLGWTVSIDFAPFLTANTSEIYVYSLTAPFGQVWKSARVLQRARGLGSEKSITTICSNSVFTSDCKAVHVKQDSPSIIISLTIPLETIYVRTNYFLDSDLGLDELLGIDTEFTAEAAPVPDAPGPLPILGVGTAFGFSRKLRQRIKASR
jgi:hypothetical protein